MAFEFNPFTGSLDSVGLSQASADARYVLKVAGSFSGLTGAGFRDTSAAFDVTLGFTSSAALTAARALTLDVVNASRSIKLAGNVDLGGNFTTTGSGTLALGGFTLTVPATGTAALLGTANVFTAAQTITSTVGASALTLNGGTQTSSFPVLTMNQTWNNVATTFTGHLLNITNTASASTSLFQNFQLEGVSRFAVGLTGISRITDGSSANASLLMSGSGTYTTLATSSGAIILSSGGISVFSAWGTNSMMSSNVALSWCPGVLTSLNPDTFICRKTTATIQMGLDAAGVTNQMFTAASRITSDGPGADLKFAGGNGRGGAGGSLIFSTYTTAGAGVAGTLTTRLTLDTAGLLTFADAVDLAFNTTTGTKIGTSATQKVGFWNATPVVQPATGGATSSFSANMGTPVLEDSTWDGYTISVVIAALRNIGILA